MILISDEEAKAIRTQAQLRDKNAKPYNSTRDDGSQGITRVCEHERVAKETYLMLNGLLTRDKE